MLQSGMAASSAPQSREYSSPLSAIVHSATEEFLTHGYESASIDRIVASARVSKTTFYHSFKSKRAVWEAALNEVRSRISRSFPAPSPAADLRETLLRFGRWTRQVASCPEYLGLFRVSFELARLEPDHSPAIHGLVRDRKGPLCDYLEQLGAAIRFPADALNAQFSFLSIGALAAVIPCTGCSAEEEERWLESLAALFVSGYRRDPAGKSSSSLLFTITGRPLPRLESGGELYQKRRSAGMRLSREDFEALLSTCAESFLEQGYHKTSLPDISTRTGISRMTLRRQFSSKAELFVASISHYARSLYSKSEPLPPAAGKIDVALTVIAQQLRARFQRPDNIRLLRLMVAHAADFPALAGAVYAWSRHDDLSQLSSRFAEWMSRGEFGITWADLAPYHFHTLAINGNAALFRSEGTASDATPADIASLFLDGCQKR